MIDIDKSMLQAAKDGDTYACNQIIKTYENIIEQKVKAKGYFYYSDDYQELLQCGRLAVYKGILAYNDRRNASFDTFVNHIIDNELINYLKKLNTQKQKINSNTLPLNNQGEVEMTGDNGDTMTVPYEFNTKTPESELIDEESLSYTLRELGLKLSDMEFDILKLKISGCNNKEIAETLHINIKSVENAVARIKTKIDL